VSFYSDLMNSGEDLLFGTFGGSSVTYNAGSTAVAITDGWKGEEARGPGDARAIDIVSVAWRFRASDLTAVVPSSGDTITEGAKTWTVDTVVPYGQHEFLAVQASRRVQRGAA